MLFFGLVLIYYAGAQYVGLLCLRGSEEESKNKMTITMPDKEQRQQKKKIYGNERIFKT
jgi:hypothetical protein